MFWYDAVSSRNVVAPVVFPIIEGLGETFMVPGAHNIVSCRATGCYPLLLKLSCGLHASYHGDKFAKLAFDQIVQNVCSTAPCILKC